MEQIGQPEQHGRGTMFPWRCRTAEMGGTECRQRAAAALQLSWELLWRQVCAPKKGGRTDTKGTAGPQPCRGLVRR